MSGRGRQTPLPLILFFSEEVIYRNIDMRITTRSLLIVTALCGAHHTTAQTVVDKVGVDTRTPTEVLDVNGTMRVRQLPQKGNSTIFTTTAGTASATANQPFVPNRLVVADANGVLGAASSAAPRWFYMPSVPLPLDPSKVNPPYTTEVSGTYSVQLYNLFAGQFSGGAAFPNRVASSATATLPTPAAADLDYFVTYYDDAVFDHVGISATGLLTYTLKPGFVVSPRTYMNIVFQVKE